MRDHGLDLAVIGNGRTAALLDPEARLVWWCYPRFDSDPVFCRLVSGEEEKGFTDVLLDGLVDFQSEYLRNTAVVITVLTDEQGGAVRITDFAPRHRQFGRVFRPPQLVRIIEPIAGLPRITIRFRPTHDYGHAFMHHSLGSNHIRFLHEGFVIRLTSDAPLSYIEREAPFVLTRPLHLVFGIDEPFQGDLVTTCREFCDRTIDYWLDWSRGLSISYDWQDEIIRAAITLKLSNFEETGGIIAAHTTSIPEAPGSGRNWDYRYCWLRDAYFVVKALNRIGATQTMEDFISFTLGIASNPNEQMRPVYGVVPIDPMHETQAGELKGYRGDGLCASATPQRSRSRTTPMAASSSPRCPCSTIAGCRDWATRDCFGCWRHSEHAPASSHWRRTTASGNIAGGNASIPIRPRCAGQGVTASLRSHRNWAWRTGPLTGTRWPNPCSTRSSNRPGTRNGRPLPRPSAPMTLTRAFCSCPTSE
jgi:hypothetical protein